MRIYTKQGDAGKTGLSGGQRVSKDSLRVSAYGNVDELNAVLGVLRASGVPSDLDDRLERVQNELFILGSDLSAPIDSARIPRIVSDYIAQLEQEIDLFETDLEPLRQFILPGGAFAASYAHLARTVCRRAERSIVTLAEEEPVNAEILPYVNRLSDWLFVLARLLNVRAGMSDVPWHSPTTTRE